VARSATSSVVSRCSFRSLIASRSEYAGLSGGICVLSIQIPFAKRKKSSPGLASETIPARSNPQARYFNFVGGVSSAGARSGEQQRTASGRMRNSELIRWSETVNEQRQIEKLRRPVRRIA